ncbi:phosphoserine phosphatase SerB [Moraxella nasicaprae]|uniref:Phosphoserine phosphatase n=1 Tax=Moraxella nasicaprae TaxID=2904122 RepID=A0ABY6F5V8_9GAMM|nr:phosphoserine phosphatase SerB [Moraxella nasicaprae]UXZ05449.1 phosphoserine phosphatase SerB [Moraxella nasicaprae]
MMHHYTLQHGIQDWQNALQALHLAPESDWQSLPLFGIVLVGDVPIQSVQSWADEHRWQLVPLTTQKSTVDVVNSLDNIHNTSVYRCVIFSNAIIDQPVDELPRLIKAQLTSRINQAMDIHILPIDKLLRPHRLACFDMDSTLIEQEVIVELARYCHIDQEVSHITESAMRGEIDFATSFSRRVALLAGADQSIIEQIIANNITFQSGALATIQSLKALGYHTVLVSGGFEPFAKHVAHTLGIDEYHANPLDIAEGKLTGKVSLPILDGHQKACIVQHIAKQLGITNDQIICIGDGANDLPMMSISDIGIAYHAKPIVQEQATLAINHTGLEGVLYALGHQLVSSS